MVTKQPTAPESSARSLLTLALVGLGLTLAVMALLFWLLAWFTSGLFWFWEGEKGTRLTSVEYYDLTRSAVTFGGALAIGVTLLLAYRRQVTNDRLRQISEENLDLDRSKEASRQAELVEQKRTEVERSLRSRFTEISSQLGHEKSVSRLAGIYALGALADEWYQIGREDERQVCVDVICAYIRLPYLPNPIKQPDAGEREVRLTALKVIRDHMQTDVPTETDWRSCSIDLSDAVFDGGDLAGIEVSGTLRLDRARIMSGVLDLSRVKITGSGRLDILGATIDGAELRLRNAELAGGNLAMDETKLVSGSITLSHAEFAAGTASFEGIECIGGDLNFTAAKFGGADVQFTSANFSGGRVSFLASRFLAGYSSFDDARFSGATVSFNMARFEEGASFDGCSFSGGEVSFRRSMFMQDLLTFDASIVDGGSLVFLSPRLRAGTISFDRLRVTEKGSIAFFKVIEEGGIVTFEGANLAANTVSRDGKPFNGLSLMEQAHEAPLDE